MNKFKIQYTDGTSFEGDPFKKDWLKIDDTKHIARLEYLLGKAYIEMTGYAEYNHTYECLGLAMKGISKILLMGRKEDVTDMIIFDLKENKIYKQRKPKYKEYRNQILAGWKKGNLKNPQTIFRKIKDFH